MICRAVRGSCPESILFCYVAIKTTNRSISRVAKSTLKNFGQNARGRSRFFELPIINIAHGCSSVWLGAVTRF